MPASYAVQSRYCFQPVYLLYVMKNSKNYLSEKFVNHGLNMILY